jgi:hypothetical protein
MEVKSLLNSTCGCASVLDEVCALKTEAKEGITTFESALASFCWFCPWFWLFSAVSRSFEVTFELF